MAKRILIVEDEAHVLAVIEKRLTTQGYEVLTAMDGREGLRRARSDRPDLIILDLILPGIDGYQVCSMLKRDAAYRHIPVMMLSARTQHRDIEQGMVVGADAYMTKPFQPAALLKQIAELLEKPQEPRKP